MGPSRYNHLSSFSVCVPLVWCRTCDKVERNLWKRWLELLQSKLRESAHRQPRARPQEGSAHIRGFSITAFFAWGDMKTTPESFRVISTARLRPSPTLHLQPINVVVSNDPQRDLILWLASCLDAFSTYPSPTRLLGRAPGGTTDSPEVGPTRSSRTSVGAPQISCARNR